MTWPEVPALYAYRHPEFERLPEIPEISRTLQHLDLSKAESEDLLSGLRSRLGYAGPLIVAWNDGSADVQVYVYTRNLQPRPAYQPLEPYPYWLEIMLGQQLVLCVTDFPGLLPLLGLLAPLAQASALSSLNDLMLDLADLLGQIEPPRM
ncbi:protein of unknown function [Candidatus Hydrogenisulfobacillus filiaventi]|uniref:Uncharacterized protein n=1 Tax=Candidatus Hydrogenisulfobacillus filiaventi TaxID=2707344 RepID=A0A6F8ZJS0_9FIRM|nr:hypothetical protein [Bacillota bacterium]CAB1130038.1 protein of unknown function [Candidatus Hydrogenisulfobacillus filiaventi]